MRPNIGSEGWHWITLLPSAGILELQYMYLWGARNQEGIRLSYRPGLVVLKFQQELHIGWRNRFLGIELRGSLKVSDTVSDGI
jgi:hypothetical protein